MRAEENILEIKVREFLDGKLAELVPGADGSVTEKVFAIYALFQEGIPPYSQANANIAKTILDCMGNPAELFADAPKNSGITTLDIQCEFRRQLVRYIWALVPAELRADKKESFEKALKILGQIETQLSARNLGGRGAAAATAFVTGFLLLGLYFYNSDGKFIVGGSLWGVLGALLILSSLIFGTHTTVVACRQKKSMRLFQNVEQTESTALISSGNVQMGSFQNDLFSEASIMRVATAKLIKAYENNEDVTYQRDGESGAVAVAALAIAASF